MKQSLLDLQQYKIDQLRSQRLELDRQCTEMTQQIQQEERGLMREIPESVSLATRFQWVEWHHHATHHLAILREQYLTLTRERDRLYEQELEARRTKESWIRVQDRQMQEQHRVAEVREDRTIEDGWNQLNRVKFGGLQ